MAIKLVVTDLDRTLLHDDGSVSENSGRIFKLAKEKGIYTAIATGRSAEESMHAITATGADEYIIIYTGARVLNLKENFVVSDRFIDEDKAIEALTYLKKFKSIFCLVYASGRTMALPHSFENIAHFKGNKEFFKNAIEQMATDGDPVEYIKRTHIKINKLFMMNLNEDEVYEIEEHLKKIGGLSSMRTQPLGLDVLAEGTDKGSAVLELAKHLGLKREEVMVLGDSGNDRAMFIDGVFKVAVSNASEEILSLADYITLSNNEDGAALAVKKFCLEDET